jgi:hypothetical protein
MTLEQIPLSGSKKLENTLRERICRVCVDRSLQGDCEKDAAAECALFDSFPAIVQAISRADSDLIDDYVAAVRAVVCAQCDHQDNDGMCDVRDQVRCVLDRYLVLIVQIVEEFQARQLRKSSGMPTIAKEEA